MPANAMFWIASTSKPMTVTAFMMLVDEGKVSLNDPVEKYLPEFHGQMVKAANDGKAQDGQAASGPQLLVVGKPSDSRPRDTQPYQRLAVQVIGSARRSRHIMR